LALYYLLVIRYGWKNDYIANRIEPWMHFVAIGFAVSTGVAGLALDLSGSDLCLCSTQFHLFSWKLKGGSTHHRPLITFSEPSSVLNEHIAFEVPTPSFTGATFDSSAKT
jgi:hypothetical protein